MSVILSRGSLLLPPASGRAAILGLWAHYPSITSTFPEPFHFVSVSPPLPPPLLFFTRTSVIGLKAHLKPQKLTSGKGLYRGHYIEVLEMQASGNLSAEHTTSVELSSPVFQSTDWGGVLSECLRRSPPFLLLFGLHGWCQVCVYNPQKPHGCDNGLNTPQLLSQQEIRVTELSASGPQTPVCSAKSLDI